MITLRDYQEECLAKLRLAFGRNRSVILQMPTGSGKTAIAAAVAEGLAARGLSMLALVHRRELVDQFADTLERVGLYGNYGIIAAGRAPTPWAPFQIGSVQTLYRRPLEMITRKPRYIVVDECRHAKAKMWEEVLARFPESKILGLDATPERLDGKPLGDHFDEIVAGPSIEWLVANRRLAPTTLKYVPRGIVTRGVPRVAGDYNRSRLGTQVSDRVIAAPVNAFFKYAVDRRVIFFAVNRRDSQAVADRLTARGVRAAHVDAQTPATLRDQLINEFRNGDVQVLCNVDIVGEGFDCPMCDCVMMGVPTMSLSEVSANGGPVHEARSWPRRHVDRPGGELLEIWEAGPPENLASAHREGPQRRQRSYRSPHVSKGLSRVRHGLPCPTDRLPLVWPGEDNACAPASGHRPD